MISVRLTLYSVTSYWHGKLEEPRRYRWRLRLHDFCGPADGPGFIPFPAQSQDNVPSLDQFTQEVRIASNNSGGLGYQAGIFYFDENLDIETFDFPTPDRDRHPMRSSTSARTPRRSASSARSITSSTRA